MRSCIYFLSQVEAFSRTISPKEKDFFLKPFNYLYDAFYVILKPETLVLQIKCLKLNEGLHLLKRYRKNGGIACEFNDHCKDARIWKHSSKVIELIADTLLTNAVLNDSLIDSDTLLPDLLAEWASIYKPAGEDKLPEIALEIMKKLALAANSSRCIYPFCDYIMKHVSGFPIIS